jgi:anti-sigma factor RsiW
MIDDLACNAAVELMTDYVEGELAAAEAARLEHHLQTCPGCGEYLAQLRSVAEALGGFTADTLPPAVRDYLIAAFRDFRR